MKRSMMLALVGAVMALAPAAGVQAANTKPAKTKPATTTTTLTQLHVKKSTRVDGSSDLHGVVRARSGLRVTAGISTDTLDTTGPVKVGGILQVAGAISSAGLNAGTGPIVSSGLLQGGSLTVGGDTTLGGALTVAKGVTVAAGLHVGGPLDAGAISTGGDLTAGTVTGTVGTFSRLAVPVGGSVNFNNATLNASGLNLTGNLKVPSLQLNGSGGTPALTIVQGSSTATVAVDTTGNLAIGGAGLTAPSLAVANNVNIGGTLTVNKIGGTSGLSLSGSNVQTSGNLTVGSGNLQLDLSTTSGAAHIVGNKDTRGQCTATASPGSTAVCTVAFATTYPTVPMVVATPYGSNPLIVTGYSVAASTGGLNIYFRVSQAGSVTFNYMVQD